MPFKFSKKLSGSIKPFIDTAKRIANITGANLTGDEYGGSFNGKTIAGEIRGSYTVRNGLVRVTIHKKPVLVSKAKLLRAFETYFA